MDANGCFYAAGGRGAGEWESKKISAWRGCRSHAETKKVKFPHNDMRRRRGNGGSPGFYFFIFDRQEYICLSVKGTGTVNTDCLKKVEKRLKKIFLNQFCNSGCRIYV